MSKRRIYRACLAWILAICMVFSGSAWTGLTAYAAGEATTGDEEIVPGEIGVVGETEGTEIQETDEDGEGGEVTQGEDPVEPTGKVTITFNYGLNEEYLKEAKYAVDGTVFSTKIEVNKGESWDDIQGKATLPVYGKTINRMNFSGDWTDAEGNYLAYYRSIDEDTTVYAHWTHVITYHAEEGHFYGGETGGTMESNYLSEDNTLLDISPVCYPAAGTTRAFVGWGIKNSKGDITPVYDMLSQLTVYQNTDLYAIYTDGYTLTIDVNLAGGSISGYYESYKDADGYPWLGNYISLSGDGVTKLSFTYPVGVKPSQAKYFCYNPVYYSSYLDAGDNTVIFSNWSTDAKGLETTYFENLTPAGDGKDTLYANWKEYWTVTYDPNGKGYYSAVTEKVIRGKSISSMPYFEYSDDTGYYVRTSFNTKTDGTGETVDYSYIPTGNVTLYAQYKGIYKIWLDGNGGSILGYYNSFAVDRGDPFKDDLKDWVVIWPDETDENGKVTKINRNVLKEWRTNADGTGETTPFTPKADTTLYAIPEEGWLVTFHTGAVEGDENNENGTIFSFRNKSNVTDATFAYSKNRPMRDVPYLSTYINEENKRFAGWSTVYGDASKIIDPYTYTPDKDTDLYAVWYDLVPITYRANGGAYPGYYDEGEDDDIFVDRVIKGDKFTLQRGNEPQLDGFVLAGWTEREGSSKVIPYGATYTATSPMDFYAVWEAGYNITLDGNGGSVHYMSHSGHEHFNETGNAKFTIKKGSTVLQELTSSDDEYSHESSQVGGWHEEGLLLAGWSKTKGGEPIDLYNYVPQGDETFYAIWEVPCKVTFDPDGGYLDDYSKTQDVIKGGHVSSLPAPTAENKYFVGWFMEDGSTRFDANTEINSNITVKAKWSEEKATVSFDAGKGATLYDNSTHENAQTVTITTAKGARIDLSSYKPKRKNEDDYVFGGWKSGEFIWNKNSSQRYYDVTGDVAFEAIWDKIVYLDVTFDGNGGNVIDSDNPDDSTTSLTIERIPKGNSIGSKIYASKKDSEFTGWYLDAACTQLASTADKIASYKLTETITLYAGWKEEEKVAVSDITLSKEKLTLGVSDKGADSYTLKAVVSPANATNGAVTFVSSDENVATVTQAGVITAVKVGTATITVSTVDGNISKSCEVTVDTTSAAEVNNALKNAADAMKTETGKVVEASVAKEALDNALSGIGDTEKLADLVESDEKTASKLKELEKAYVEAANVEVKDPSKDESNLATMENTFGVSKEEVTGANFSVSGAGLNADPGETVELSVDSVDASEEKQIDEKYENAKQVDINLNVTSNGETKQVEELDAPVTLVLPIPSGMIRSKLYILHFNEDGSFDIIRPVFKGNMMIFTVSHFSRFAFVELAETITPSGGNGGEDQPTTPGGNDPATPGGNDPATPGGNGSTTPSGTNPTTPGATDTTTTGSTTETPVAPAVKDGDAVSEAGSTARYTVSSATDKTVAYTGDTAASGKITIKSTVTDGTNTYTVTSIADGAFKKSKVTAVTIPETVDSIGKGAFEGSTKLKTLTIKGTKLTSIGDNAFKGCSALTKVTLPKNVKTVGKNAFSNCKKLKTITVKSKKTKFAKNSLKGVPKSATIKLPKMTAKEKKAYKKMLKSAGFKGKIK